MSKRFLGFLAPLQLRREHSLPSPSIPALSVPAFSISAEAEARADEYLHSLGLRPGEPFIAIAPGARNNQQKCWPLAHYCELAQTLAGGGTRLLLFGLPSELPALKLIQCAAYGKPIIVDSRNDIPYAAALLRQSQALVCNDSGLMHLAAAVGTNVVALFGPSDPLCSAPMGSAEIVLLSRSKHCPRDCLSKKHPCRCLAEIQPREVAPILSRMISPVSQRRGCNNLSEVFP